MPCVDLEKRKQYARAYYLKNRQQAIERASAWAKANPDRARESQNKSRRARLKTDPLARVKRSEELKKWRSNNRDKENTCRRRYRERRFSEDPRYKKEHSLRGIVPIAIKAVREDRDIRLIGCSGPFFRKHIESLWKHGMSWDNYGVKGWHIDHIIPCKNFDLLNPEHQKQCFHYTNMQPLWWYENLEKSRNGH